MSFAWDPGNDGRMSVRGGFGRFYNRMSNQIWDSEHQNLPRYANASTTVNQPVRPLFALGSNSVLPYGFPFPAGLAAGVRPNGGLVNGTAAVVAADSDAATEYTNNWFLGVQRAFGQYIVVEANYVGSRGSDMYYRWDINRFAGDLLDGRLDHHAGLRRSELHAGGRPEQLRRGQLLVRVRRNDLNLGATSYTL